MFCIADGFSTYGTDSNHGYNMKIYYVLQGTSFIQYKQAATDKLIVLWYHRLCCTVSHNLRNKKKTIRALEVGQG